jgi:Lactoylglutathione lyase and related lyases
MKNLMLLLLCAIIPIAAFSQDKSTGRPRITGIDHAAFYTTNPEGAKNLFANVLGLPSAAPIEPGETTRYTAGMQWVGYSPAPDAKATDRMDHTAFTTNNVPALRRYLAEKGFKPSQVQGQAGQSLSFSIKDPEGHRIEFVQRPKRETASTAPAAVSRRLIHVGFLVYDRAAEDHFYRDILGFRPYWHGGMKDGETDWVSLQVPDGTDWLEYMLNQPAHPDLQLTGVMNHISFGVADMKKCRR